MQLIVTGFGKFADFTYNPSQLAVEALPETLLLANSDDPIPTTRLVFESCCEESWKTISSALSRLPAEPTVVILTGLASRRERISLERFALNIRDYRIPDNNGHQPMDEAIDPSGPEAFRTTLPLPALAERLTELGYPCEVSNHAGSFLCNDIYYRCLQAGQQSRRPALSLFVHLPPPESYKKAKSDSAETAVELSEEELSEVIESYTAALAQIARFACSWLMNTTTACTDSVDSSRKSTQTVTKIIQQTP